MKCSLGISNFLEEISSLSHSIVFLYFFALISEEGFLYLSLLFFRTAFKWIYLSFSPLPLASLLFSAICYFGGQSSFEGFDYRTYTGLGKQILGGHKQNLVCTPGPRRKEQ